MHNITLIATIHSESGQCNSDELYKILKDINPEIIFEELPIHFSEMYYSNSFDTYCANNILLNRPAPVISLEVKSIKKYKQNYDLVIVPVDIDLKHKISEQQDETLFLFQTLFENDYYKKLDYEKDVSIANEGFAFLNSNKFLDFLKEKEMTIKNIIESNIQKERLLNIYKLFRAEQYDCRENAMLQNIYNYSIENQYNTAVFLIGAEHKESIMQKIKEYEKLSEVKLNWTMYSNF